MSLERPRIGYISDERFPSRWTDTQQIMKTAAALAAEGADVEVILPRPARFFLASAAARRAALEQHYGIDVRFRLTQIPTVPASRLRIEKLVHGLAAPVYSAAAGHDVIYTRNLLPVLLGLAAGRSVVFESHRVLRRHYPMVYRCIHAVRHHPRFLGVVTNAGMIASAFHEMGFPAERVTVAHNCFDPKDLEPRLGREEARRRLRIPGDARIVCYAGHIQRRKGIETVVALASRTPEVQYLICGGFPADVAEARRLADAAGAHNLRFTGWIDVPDLAVYLYAADVLLIPPAKAPLEQYGNTVLPIKTYNYLAAGRVIVAPRLPDVVEVLHDGENALLATPDAPDEAAAVIRRALNDPALADRLGARAARDAARYTWRGRARHILDFIRQRLAATAMPAMSDVRRQREDEKGTSLSKARAP
jgi:glycosyltransferase involved in cell wall biosynthesis